MDKLEKYELVNSCETIEELESAIIALAEPNDDIKGRTRNFNAKRMSENVKYVVRGECAINVLTREFGIRQQALYLKFYHRE